MLDNRASAGVSDQVILSQGLPPGSGQGLFEEACYTCGHCETQVVKNRERTRPRGFCKKCNHILCDGCDAIYHASAHECTNYKHRIEELREADELDLQRSKF